MKRNMIGKPKQLIQWLFDQDKNKLFEIKEHKEKRSLNANAYFWQLVGKIADVLRTPKEDVYKTMLFRYGQHQTITVDTSVDVSRFFQYAELIHRDYDYTDYLVAVGSSHYNTQEMSVLIDGVISEAKELDIETLPPWEIERMKQRWQANPS